MIIPGTSSWDYYQEFVSRYTALNSWYTDPQNAAAVAQLGGLPGLMSFLSTVDKGVLTDKDTLNEGYLTLTSAERTAENQGYTPPSSASTYVPPSTVQMADISPNEIAGAIAAVTPLGAPVLAYTMSHGGSQSTGVLEGVDTWAQKDPVLNAITDPAGPHAPTTKDWWHEFTGEHTDGTPGNTVLGLPLWAWLAGGTVLLVGGGYLVYRGSKAVAPYALPFVAPELAVPLAAMQQARAAQKPIEAQTVKDAVDERMSTQPTLVRT